MTVTLPLCPWPAPSHATVMPRKATRGALPAEPIVVIPLEELDAEALSALCNRFRAEVFARAGKPDPMISASS